MTTEPTPDAPQPLTRFWQPRYWPIWLGLGWLRLMSLLPLRSQLAVGRGLGKLIYWSLSERRRIAASNVALCFPALTAAEREDLIRRHFASLGMTLMEFGLTWWASDALVDRCVDLRGAEHLREAVATGRGIVLLAGHFGAQEFTGRALRAVKPSLGALYRPNKNAFVDAVLMRIRSRSASVMIPKQNMRRMIRALRNGTLIWYAPDQSQRGPFSALIPFLGEPAMTTTALTEIVRLGNALVVPLLPMRLAAGRYTLEILPALTNFPGASAEEDAVLVNEILETHIRKAPEQYYWIHRRFKGRPAPLPDPYEKGTGP